MSQPPVHNHQHLPLNELFEQLNARIDKPIEYNHLLCSAISFNLPPIVFIDGIAYADDPSRGKRLSINRPILTAGHYGQNQNNRYLRMQDVPMAGDQGFLMPRNATIIGLWAKSRSTSPWNIEVRKNGAPITLVTVPVSGFGSDLTLNFDLNAGDTVQIYLAGSSVDHPIAGLEFAYRA